MLASPCKYEQVAVPESVADEEFCIGKSTSCSVGRAQAGLSTVFPDRPHGDGSSYDGCESLFRRGAKKQRPCAWAERAASALDREVGCSMEYQLVVNRVS